MGAGRSTRAVAGIATALALAACGPVIEPGSKRGELGAGQFVYQCVGNGDAVCRGKDKLDAFPTKLVLGGQFDVRFDADNGGAYGDTKSASQDFLAKTSSGFRAVRIGHAGILALDPSGVALDYTWVDVTPTDHLAVTDAEGNGVLTTMKAGTTQDAWATPFDAIQNELAGAAIYDWSSTDESIVGFDRASPSAIMTFRAKAAGTATVTAKMLAGDQTITTDVAITVVP